jgi:hypothetical protein
MLLILILSALYANQSFVELISCSMLNLAGTISGRVLAGAPVADVKVNTNVPIGGLICVFISFDGLLECAFVPQHNLNACVRFLVDCYFFQILAYWEQQAYLKQIRLCSKGHI